MATETINKEKNDDKKDVSDALKRIFDRNIQGQIVSKKLLVAVSILAFSTLISTMLAIYLTFISPVKRVYLAVTPDMKIMRVMPLKEAYYTDSAVGNFAVNAIVQAFNFSYIDKKTHFRTLLNHGFGETGLSSIVHSMKVSGVLDRITQDKLFVSFAVTSAPFIVQKGIVINPFSRKPTFQWVVQFRGVMTYTNGSEEATNTNVFNVTVSRVSSLERGDAIRVQSVVAKNITAKQG